MLEIKEFNISDIVEYDNNAKLHPDWQVEQIAKSIQEFGFNDPIAVNENMQIIEGHGRYLACKKLDIEKVPCIILKGMSDAQERAYIIAHNKLTMNSDFDIEKLKFELNALKVEGVDLEVTGFDLSEIDDILKDELENDTDDIEEIEDYSTNYNITIKCSNIEEARELNDKLGLNLDLTRQVLKADFKEVNI